MLKQRIITALILAPTVLGCVFFLPPLEFSVFIGVVLSIAAWEWANLAGFEGRSRYAYAAGIAVLMLGAWWLPALPVLVIAAIWWLLAFVLVIGYPALTNLWSARWIRSVLGMLVLVPGLIGLVQLKLMPDSTWLITLLFLLIWGADIGAYFAGRAFGRRKLAPDVSPGKSWAGLFGGLAFAIVIAACMMAFQGEPALLSLRGAIFLIACALIVLVSVLGDLAESMFKRYRGVKDSSNLLPGHGGVLDRVDSLLSAGPVFALFVILFRWQ